MNRFQAPFWLLAIFSVPQLLVPEPPSISPRGPYGEEWLAALASDADGISLHHSPTVSFGQVISLGSVESAFANGRKVFSFPSFCEI